MDGLLWMGYCGWVIVVQLFVTVIVDVLLTFCFHNKIVGEWKAYVAFKLAAIASQLEAS